MAYCDRFLKLFGLFIIVTRSFYVRGSDEAFNVKDIPGSLLSDVITSSRYVVVMFVSNECELCESWLLPLSRAVGMSHRPGLTGYRVNDEEVAKSYGVQKFPRILFFRDTEPIYFSDHTAFSLDPEDLMGFMEQTSEVFSQILTDDTFEHLTQASSGATTGDWFVMFYEPDCSSYIPLWEVVTFTLYRKMNVARVNTVTSVKLQKRFEIKECPTFVFFRLGKMYRYNLPMKDESSLVMYAEGFYKNIPGKPVPAEIPPFDELTNKIADTIKEQVQSGSWKFFAAIGATVVFLVAVIAFCLRRRSRRRKEHFY